VGRFVSKGELNAPWGIALAPAAFFESMKDMKNDNNGNDMMKNMKSEQIILVGNFGDGHINAYNLGGVFLKALQTHNKTLEIQGLWALAFPPATSTNGVDPNALYFTAGPDSEKDGLFGYIMKTN
jgi:hypothetical protein